MEKMVMHLVATSRSLKLKRGKYKRENKGIQERKEILPLHKITGLGDTVRLVRR